MLHLLKTVQMPWERARGYLRLDLDSIERTVNQQLATAFPGGVLNLDLIGVLPLVNGGTGTSTVFTPGSVVFAGPLGAYSQNNSKFFWDDAGLQLIVNSLKLPAINSGPFFGAGYAGIAYRNTGEAFADPALVIHANGYAFENTVPAWLAILHNDGGGIDGFLGIGIRSIDTPAVASARLHIRRGAIKIDDDVNGTNYGTISMSGGKLVLTATGSPPAVTVTGTFLDNSFGSHGFTASGTGFNGLTVVNPTAGTGNGAQFVLGTDAINNFVIQAYSSTYTTAGIAFPNGGSISNAGAGGLSFAQQGTGDIRFYTTGANVLRMMIATGGVVTTTSPVRTNGATIAALSVKQIGTAFGQGFALLTTSNDAFLELQYDGTVFKISTTYQTSEGYKPLALFTSETKQLQVETTGILSLTKTIGKYNGISTTGWGVPAIYGYARVADGRTAAVASVATYTVGAADGSFLVSANVNVTVSTLHSFTVTCNYTDETNTARILTMSFSQITGAIVTAITNATGTGAYEGIVLRIRCKASTAITFSTIGTFTTVTYNVEADATQVA